jgi:geranylgeranyl diphosphate synthase type II
LFHNAFIVHDDIEDESISRRGDKTLNNKYGIAIATNIGDALNVLAFSPLLGNMKIIGLDKSLQIFQEIEKMAKFSVEGQAMELEWVKNNYWELDQNDYFRMTARKTCWYTCISPFRLGAIIADSNHVKMSTYNRLGLWLGIAFQIQDDILNLVGEEVLYGKESAGDIWEGKRTLMLIHTLNSAHGKDKKKLIEILSKSRGEKTAKDVAFVLELMNKFDAIECGKSTAKHFALKADSYFQNKFSYLEESKYKKFFSELITYVINRNL